MIPETSLAETGTAANTGEVVGAIGKGSILLPPRFRNGFVLMDSQQTGQAVSMKMINKLRDGD